MAGERRYLSLVRFIADVEICQQADILEQKSPDHMYMPRYMIFPCHDPMVLMKMTLI